MNLIEKEKIRYWRGEGLGYKAVAAKTGLSENAVKGFCKRNGLDGEASKANNTICRQCGNRLTGDKRKKFCCATCRNAWWSRHAYLREPRAANQRRCVHCGGPFYCDPGKSRQYCGRPCYFAARYDKEVRRYDT